jgi:hypothetical protein
MTLARPLRGALAGTLAAGLWAAQQPLDQRVFEVDHDDTELLGKLVARGPEWRPIGIAMHLGNGALFGAAYALGKPFVPGPPVLRGLLAALTEHAATWPAIGLVERHHPARGSLPTLAGDRRALAQATWRHALFGIVLGALEHALNDRSADEPPPVPVSSNGHGDIEAAAVAVAT